MCLAANEPCIILVPLSSVGHCNHYMYLINYSKNTVISLSDLGLESLNGQFGLESFNGQHKIETSGTHVLAYYTNLANTWQILHMMKTQSSRYATCNCVTQVLLRTIDAHWSWLPIAIKFLVWNQVWLEIWPFYRL
jgi:hypothetical protein